LLIEKYGNLSKSWLLHIYSIIIEMGPNIYGVDEAAKFYFNKQPSELTIVECIILTYIIPRPVHFYEALKSKSLQLQRNLKTYLRISSKNLLAKGIVTKEEFDNMEQVANFANNLGTISFEEQLKYSPGYTIQSETNTS